MGGLDTRIFREAKLYREEAEAMLSRRLRRLRSLLQDEVLNMQRRSLATGISRDEVAEWLHCKWYDATYSDYGPDSKRYRTHKRIEALIELCGGDEKLLMNELAKALESYFPIQVKNAAHGPMFAWAPRVYRPVKGSSLVTVIFTWRRTTVTERVHVLNSKKGH